MEIQLYDGSVALVDDEDYPLVSPYRWHRSKFGYACSCPKWKGPKLYMHRVVMQAKKGQRIDHIDGNKLDNRKANLRLCSQSQNLMNRGRVSKKWPYKGVRLQKAHHRWNARLCYKGKDYNLGTFDYPYEAALAYDDKARQLFGPYAKVNFPKVPYAMRYEPTGVKNRR